MALGVPNLTRKPCTAAASEVEASCWKEGLWSRVSMVESRFRPFEKEL